MKDLKLGFQFLKYAYGRKGAIACAVVAFLVAFLMCIASMLTVINLPGGYFFLLAAFIPCQSFVSLYASDLVMASPDRKRLEISVYSMMLFAGSVFSYLLLLVMGGIVAVCSPEQIRYVCSQLIRTSVWAVITSLYWSACRKFFITSTIAFVLIMMLFESFNNVINMEWWMPSMGEGWGLFAGAALEGMALILCSGGLLYLINLVLYKAPMSKLSQMAGLRKSL